MKSIQHPKMSSVYLPTSHFLSGPPQNQPKDRAKLVPLLSIPGRAVRDAQKGHWVQPVLCLMNSSTDLVGREKRKI